MKLIIIKLGGSVITDKSKEKKADLTKIRQLCKELSQSTKHTNDLILLGHGGGSFPHPVAKKYKTQDGLINKRSLQGLALVREACLELNLIMISELIKIGVPAVSIAPFDVLVASGKKPQELFISPVVNLLRFGFLPVVYGDAISDTKIGTTIYSTETILNLMAIELVKYGYSTKYIIEIGNTKGVYDERGQTISLITSDNFFKIENILAGSESTDVTGGMLHKVKAACQMAKRGVPTLITSADLGNLKKAIMGNKVNGTWVK